MALDADGKARGYSTPASLKAMPSAAEHPSPAKRRRKRRRRPGVGGSTASQGIALSTQDRTPPLPDGPVYTSGLFGRLPVSGEVARALKELGYTAPTPIQEETIPLIRTGRDVVGQAQTGTGKTAAFGIPLVETVSPDSPAVQGLVLVPTRELALQVTEEVRRIGKFRRIKAAAIFGGQGMGGQLDELSRGVQIVVATPGRLLDHMGRGTIRLDDVGMVVLDEADQMLDIGFAPDIIRILKQTPRQRQTLLFSATMPPPIRRIADRFMRDPQRVRVGEEAEPVEEVEQVYYEVAERDRVAALSELLEGEGISQALIFRRTKVSVDRLVESLKRKGYEAQGIHGDMSQSQRLSVMRRFRAGNLRLLVATNVAARGLDISGISHVINYDMPDTVEEYIHRIGRTARMGQEGTAITFVSEWDFDMFKTIQEHVGEDLQQRFFRQVYR